jgi:hypothetical protein
MTCFPDAGASGFYGTAACGLGSSIASAGWNAETGSRSATAGVLLGDYGTTEVVPFHEAASTPGAAK